MDPQSLSLGLAFAAVVAVWLLSSRFGRARRRSVAFVPKEPAMSTRRISPNEAHDLIAREGYVYLDVRTPAEYEQGHPRGSANVPVALKGPGGMEPNPEFVAQVRARFQPDARLVIGCQSGVRSQRAVAALEQAGYGNLVEQRAGFGGARDASGQITEPGWSGAGLPVESGPDAGTR